MIIERNAEGRATRIIYDTHTEVVPYLSRINPTGDSLSTWAFGDTETIYIPDTRLKL